ncbi:MAG: hypothetical protein KKG59_07770 [Nanoarchaeota archaeon]|nr:hypothetical protein [Nanoarchaeota archaeon]
MNKPVFVKIDDYQEILNIVDVIKANLLKTKQTISSINSLKKKEDDILAGWNKGMDEISKRVEDISQTLFAKND